MHHHDTAVSNLKSLHRSDSFRDQGFKDKGGRWPIPAGEVAGDRWRGRWAGVAGDVAGGGRWRSLAILASHGWHPKGQFPSCPRLGYA